MVEETVLGHGLELGGRSEHPSWAELRGGAVQRNPLHTPHPTAYPTSSNYTSTYMHSVQGSECVCVIHQEETPTMLTPRQEAGKKWRVKMSPMQPA